MQNMTAAQPAGGKSQPAEFKGRKTSIGGRGGFRARGRGGFKNYRKSSEGSSKSRTSAGVAKKSSGCAKNSVGNAFGASGRRKGDFGGGGVGGGIGMMPT